MGTPLIDLGNVWERLGQLQVFSFRVSFARPEDLLVCDFIFDNLALALEPAADGSPRLVRTKASAPATLIVELPPQSFGEQAFLDATGAVNEEFPETSAAVQKKNVASPAEALGELPFAKIRMAGRSRIALAMPEDETELAFTLDAILDACRRWPMRLASTAVPEPKPLWLEKITIPPSAVFDKNWLLAVTSSNDWKAATESVLGQLRESGLRERLITRVALQLVAQARELLESGEGADLGVLLSRQIETEARRLTQEIPRLGEDGHPLLVAAIALASTAAIAEGLREFDLAFVGLLPFLPIWLGPHRPSPTVTALELPYRVVLSPIPKSNWWHTLRPVTHQGRTELWHTRLTDTQDGIGPDPATRVRAIWSPDYPLSEAEIIPAVNAPAPFRMSLDALDRQMLVRLMAGFGEKDADEATFVPRAARAQRLSLSALGALLDAEGNWNQQPAGVGLEQWRHLATLGRDHYVRVVYRGFLFGFQHAASLIKVTERKFEYLDKERRRDRVAVLRQRFFIVVREAVKTYAGGGHTFDGRNFPFTSVEILSRVTPDLLAPDHAASQLSGFSYNTLGVPRRACFWPRLSASSDFIFQIAATDLAGQRVTFAMPLLFVGVEANQKPVAVSRILELYRDAGTSSRRRTSLRNASVAYAPAGSGDQGDTRLPTSEMSFVAGAVSGLSKSSPQFYPEVEHARVGIASIQRLLRKPGLEVSIEYPDAYKKDGFKAGNPGEVFLKTREVLNLDFGADTKSDTLGGLATPSMSIQGLSRIMGPVAAQAPATPAGIETALQTVIDNKFNPVDFFKGAKILGGIDLGSLLAVVTSLVGANVPKLLSRELPDRIEATFDWDTTIQKSDPLGLFVHSPDGAETRLAMHGVIRSPLNGGASTFEAEASLRHFKVNLFGFILIWFDQLKFLSKTGSKPDVAVDLHPGDRTIEFGGPLEFVNQLRELIPANGFSDPPGLEITPSGIAASYSLNIPAVQVGIFALEHVSIGARFVLPFDARPIEVRFNFAERERIQRRPGRVADFPAGFAALVSGCGPLAARKFSALHRLAANAPGRQIYDPLRPHRNGDGGGRRHHRSHPGGRHPRPGRFGGLAGPFPPGHVGAPFRISGSVEQPGVVLSRARDRQPDPRALQRSGGFSHGPAADRPRSPGPGALGRAGEWGFP